jgi:hypothetical protein
VLVLDFVQRKPGAKTVNQKFCEAMQLAFVSAHRVGTGIALARQHQQKFLDRTRDAALLLCGRFQDDTRFARG